MSQDQLQDQSWDITLSTLAEATQTKCAAGVLRQTYTAACILCNHDIDLRQLQPHGTVVRISFSIKYNDMCSGSCFTKKHSLCVHIYIYKYVTTVWLLTSLVGCSCFC